MSAKSSRKTTLQKTLTGSNFDELILDAHAAPIGDVSLEDPNWFHENKLKY